MKLHIKWLCLTKEKLNVPRQFGKDNLNLVKSLSSSPPFLLPNLSKHPRLSYLITLVQKACHLSFYLIVGPTGSNVGNSPSDYTLFYYSATTVLTVFSICFRPGEGKVNMTLVYLSELTDQGRQQHNLLSYGVWWV